MAFGVTFSELPSQSCRLFGHTKLGIIVKDDWAVAPQFIHNLYWRQGYPLSFALLFTRFPSNLPPTQPQNKKKISTISSFSKVARSDIPSCTSNLFFCLHDCLRWVNLRAFRREVELPLALTLDALETLTLRSMDRALENCCQSQEKALFGKFKDHSWLDLFHNPS